MLMNPQLFFVMRLTSGGDHIDGLLSTPVLEGSKWREQQRGNVRQKHTSASPIPRASTPKSDKRGFGLWHRMRINPCTKGRCNSRLTSPTIMPLHTPSKGRNDSILLSPSPYSHRGIHSRTNAPLLQAGTAQNIECIRRT